MLSTYDAIHQSGTHGFPNIRLFEGIHLKKTPSGLKINGRCRIFASPLVKLSRVEYF
jgi:hypothetical protein